MHEYTTKELPKLKLIYWLTVLSIVITPIISTLYECLIKKFFVLDKIKEIAFYSISGFFVFSILWEIVNKWLWKIIPFLKVPVLEGKWKIIGESIDYRDITPKPFNWEGTLIIKQTLSQISITLQTNTSQSSSFNAILEDYDKKKGTLTYTYKNNNLNNNPKWASHEGMCRIYFDLTTKTAKATYCNNKERPTYGTMNITKD